jgi:hypothetical protein
MQSTKEKKQVALLIALLLAFGVCLLLGMPYEHGYSVFGLMSELSKREADLVVVEQKLVAYQKARAAEKLDKEQSQRDAEALKWMEAQVQGPDPQLWFARMFDEDGERLFNIRTSKPGRVEVKPVPEGMGLPLKEIPDQTDGDKTKRLAPMEFFSYKITVEGGFNDIGRFIAHVENKYPLMAIRSISLKGGEANDSVCTAEIVFRVLKNPQ